MHKIQTPVENIRLSDHDAIQWYDTSLDVAYYAFANLLILIDPGLAWIVIPLPISLEIGSITYKSWRMFLGVISLPTFIIAVITYTYPESPKFLVSQGKTDEALAVLQQIYAVNTGRDKSEFPVNNFNIRIDIFRFQCKSYNIDFFFFFNQVKELLSDVAFEVEKGEAPSSSDVLTKLLKNIWWQLRTISSPPHLKYCILLWTLYFANMFGWVSI